MEENFCLSCGKPETPTEILIALRPDNIWQSKYLCKTCIKDLGGINKALQWVEDKFATKIHNTT